MRFAASISCPRDPGESSCMLAQFQPPLYAVQSRVDPVQARVPMHKYDGPEHVRRERETTSMRAEIKEKRDALAALCRRYGVARLEVFGSAARDGEFDASRSDADVLVTFTPARNDLAAFADLKEALENLLGRSVDLVEREAVEASRNFIRRRAILREAETVYG
jgi:predicted nucleotidyltransferase